MNSRSGSPLTAENLARLEQTMKTSATSTPMMATSSNPPLTAENLALLEESTKDSEMVTVPKREPEKEQRASAAEVQNSSQAASQLRATAERSQPSSSSPPLKRSLPYQPRRRANSFPRANQRPLFPSPPLPLGNPPARDPPSHNALPLAIYHQDHTKPGNMAAHLMYKKNILDTRAMQAFRRRRKKVRSRRRSSLLACYREDNSDNEDEDEQKDGNNENDEDEKMIDAKSDYTGNQKNNE
ncbi:hypothetical protein F5Y18DRAFT_424335 [Xylariaceae sp. FL1019]|nr:hypothetical protein F5Y18DRAFT_424335 [Xylariaceae sp. FL1019]